MTTSLLPEDLAVCQWQADPTGSHPGYHHGWPCPLDIVHALRDGQPDPRDGVAEWRIDLPFAAGKPPLSLNDRPGHWAAHATKVSTVKAITRNAIRDAQVPALGHVHVEMHYRPATNRFRDVDNLVATLKPCIDAMHQPDERSHWAPILPSDDHRYVSWSAPILHPWQRGLPAATWLILRSFTGPEHEHIPFEQEALL